MSGVNEDMKIFLMNSLLFEGFNSLTARYLVAQAAHETSNFTSKIFRENNNLFGMKFPKVRKTTAIGERYGHAIYNSLKESVEDIALYHKALALPTVFKDTNSFVEALKAKKYFEADVEDYKKAVNHFYTMYFVGNK